MEFNKSIIREINLTENQGLSAYMNYSAQQHHDVYVVFYNFIKKAKPKRILEIGTALGGFTQFLKEASNDLLLDVDILSYDIYERPWYGDLKNNGIDVRVENIFNDDYSHVKEEVVNFIKKDGITIVLCDGGNKVMEFNILSKYLKAGDFIMAHDYAPDINFFSQFIYNKIWNWCEITDDDIQKCCEENNLISYEKDSFLNVVWVCKRKL